MSETTPPTTDGRGRRPVIGITTQTLEEIPDKLPRCWIMSQRYVSVLAAAGAVPWIVPLLADDTETLRRIYDQLDGIFLPGGVDMDPASYCEPRLPYCDRSDPDRDRTELTFTRWAIEDRKPLFAVCRGAQVLNVAVGGTLYQDLAAQYPGSIKHDYFPTGGRYTRDFISHEVNVAAGTRLGRLIGVGRVPVNSMHHQGIKHLAPTLIPSAIAPDGLIEAVEGHGEQFLIGVQWHPESLVDTEPRMQALYIAFLAAALEFQRTQAGVATG